MKKFLSNINTWLANLFNPAPLVRREHLYRFNNGIRVFVELSTHYPRYCCTYSEPLSSWLVGEFREWREPLLKAFEEENNITFSESELSNEVIRYYPLPPQETYYDRRNRHHE